MDDHLDRCPLGVLEMSPAGEIRDANDTAARLLDVEPDDLVGSAVDEVYPHSVERTLPRLFERGPASGEGGGEGTGAIGPDDRDFEEFYPSLDRWLAVSVVPSDDAVLVYLDEVTDRRRSEQTAEELRDELTRLSIIDGLLADVLGELVDASSREEIAQTISERLGETEIYEFAWLGEREVGGDSIVVRAAAGATGDTLERVRECLDGSTSTPEERAVESGSAQVVQPIADDESVPEPVRVAAFADGIHSLLAIPLTYGDSVYGVVGVYAPEQDAFSERERASFETLGEMAGYAINASRQRNLLLSDTVTELTFEVTDASAPLVAVARELGAELTLDGTVVQGQQRLLCYLTADDTPTDELRETAVDTDGVVDARVISDRETGGSVEVELVDETPLLTVTNRGASIRTATFEADGARIVVELPADEEVRRVAEAVTRAFDADLIAKRERERSVTTAGEFRDELSDRLTARQETVLRTAFFADYFESPRRSTAEEVAATLDITGSTLLYHLRAGQRKLLDAYLDTASPTRRPGGDERGDRD